MTTTRMPLTGCLAVLALLYVLWFPNQPLALVVFAVPPAALALLVWFGRARAAFAAGVLALLWFSHGVMVAWTRPAERWFAWTELLLALALVLLASWPGLTARFGGNRSR